MAAYNGIVDVTYYGSTAPSDLDPAASWHVYMAQLAGGSFTQTQVNANPNHRGVICTGGTGCGPGTRNLLDLFRAIDPVVGKAGIVYTDDTITTSDSTNNFACLTTQASPYRRCPGEPRAPVRAVPRRRGWLRKPGAGLVMLRTKQCGRACCDFVPVKAITAAVAPVAGV